MGENGELDLRWLSHTQVPHVGLTHLNIVNKDLDPDHQTLTNKLVNKKLFKVILHQCL